MENYIVRIYRRNASDPNEVVGYVECVETAENLPFTSIADLVAILSTACGEPTSKPVSAIGCGIKRFS